jgi:hypothetical protein
VSSTVVGTGITGSVAPLLVVRTEMIGAEFGIGASALQAGTGQSLRPSGQSNR